jgi:hypothetical protein
MNSKIMMKKILFFSLLLILFNSCSSGIILLKDPSFKAYYIDDKLAEQQASMTTAPEASFKLLEETTDTLLYDASVTKWFDENNVDIKAMSFHDGYTMRPMKELGVSVSWIGEFNTYEIKDKKYYLSHVVEQEHVIHFFYGSKPNEFQVINNTAVLVIRDKISKKEKAVFDFKNFVYSPEFEPKVKQFVFQNALWAYEELGVLYVCHAHSTYANSSEGMNAYITAIDWKKKKILWRSQPLVSNAINFVVKGPHIITGYGFTREGAKLYALDKKTGAVKGEIELAKARTGKKHIEFLYIKGNVIYAKAFDNTAYKVSIN